MVLRGGLWARLAVAALLGAAIWNPDLPGMQGPLHLVLLIDDSASMPRGQVDAAWRSLLPALADLPRGSRLSLIRFGARPVTEAADLVPGSAAGREILARPTPPRRLPLSDRHTDIGAALDQGLASSRDDLPTTIALISDGAANLGNPVPPLETARASGVSVLWWRPPTIARQPDAWIERLEAPRRVWQGTQVTLDLLLGADGSVDTELVLRDGGRTILRRPLRPDGPGRKTLALPIQLAGTGLHEITAELTAPDRVLENNRRLTLVEVKGPASVLMLTPDPTASMVAQSLRKGDWPLAAMRPRDFTPAALESHRVLVLEQVAVHDLPEADWQSISRAVREGGMGLVVLGGPATFGSGGYRYSTLEKLLPVLAEAPRSEPPAAVLFAVDCSGSMAQATAVGASRLALARAAVVGSARSLMPADQAGLLAFEAKARVVLPLAHRRNQAEAMESAWNLTPSGGTLLAPVLALGVQMLSAVPVQQRLLVLATDGRVADADQTGTMAARLAASGVTLVAIAIGEKADTGTLKRLTAASKGQLLWARDAAKLPVLMETAVQARRSAVGHGPLAPHLVASLPLGPDLSGPFPPIQYYQLTRPRPSARVYLAASGGEPLLAAQLSGAGRVVALPAGLGPWASGWSRWGSWGRFLGGLIQWSALEFSDPALHLHVADRPESLVLDVEALDPAGNWSEQPSLPLRLTDPAGSLHLSAVELQAPGRYAEEIAAPVPGRYDLLVGMPGSEAHLAVIHDPLEELMPSADGEKSLQSALHQGLLRSWAPKDGVPTPSVETGSRALLAGLALVLYLSILINELGRHLFGRRLGGRKE